MAMAMTLTQGCVSPRFCGYCMDLFTWCFSISKRHIFSLACFLSMIDEEGAKCSIQDSVESHEGKVILVPRAPLSFKLMEVWKYSSYPTGPTAKWGQVLLVKAVNVCISRIGSSCFMDRHSGVVVICSFWWSKLSAGLKCAKWTRKKYTADEIIFCHKNWVIPTKQTFKQTY